ncbi:MAG TPA: hypothetical protein VFQ53_06840 [Kofleriaceae bacterium]|nr:hypothetical protein [Kofleriaceae bacterium]
MIARVAIALTLATGCATARSAEQYREDTHTLLYASSTRLETCYETALAANPDAAGVVKVQFVVVARTGRLVRPRIDATHTTAPRELMTCVLDAIDGLRLEPADAQEGHATFVYEFRRMPAG